MMTFALTLAGLVALSWIGLAFRFYGRLGSFRRPVPAGAPDTAEASPVDAVVAARNEERDVGEAVASVVAQDYPGLIVRVVDDQSTDRTGAILEALAADRSSEGRLRVLRGGE